MGGEAGLAVLGISFCFLPLTPTCLASPAPGPPHAAVLRAHGTSQPPPSPVPLLMLGPLPREPSPYPPNPNPNHLNKCTPDKAWSDPPAEAHCFFPLFSNHQAELLRHDHRPLSTAIICFCGCLAHQAERFPRRRLLIHLAQLF